YMAALTRSPKNAIIHYMCGESYAMLGETETALYHWGMAADLATSWAVPHIMMAQTLLSSGRAEQAMGHAREAYGRMNSVTTAVLLMQCSFAQLDPSDLDGARRLLPDMEKVQKAVAGGEPQTLAMYATLLARTGDKTRAAEVINQAIGNVKQLNAGNVARLVKVSREFGLGLEQKVLDAVEQAAGITPQIAAERAGMMAAEGKAAAGLEYLQKAAGEKPSSEWQMVIARYRDSINDPQATKDWVAIGDDPQNQKDLGVQNLVLEAGPAWKDREFMARTVERVKALTGEAGISWRLAKARLLLMGGDDEKSSQEAVGLLSDITRTSPQLVRPHLLLAQALKNIGKRPAAVEELTAAAKLSPASAEIAIELARELQQQGRSQDAFNYLMTASKRPSLGFKERYQIAVELGNGGFNREAIAMLRSIPNGAGSDTLRSLMLADLARRSGQLDDAKAEYDKLMADLPGSSALARTVIAAAADFYASQGKMDEAKAAIGKLPRATPGVPEMMLATLNERYVGREQALAGFMAATVAAPKDASAWQQLAAFYLRIGEFGKAISAAEEGLKQTENDPELEAIRKTARPLITFAEAAQYAQLIDAASRAPLNKTAQGTLAILLDASKQAEPREQTIAKLETLANGDPRFLPLQMILVQWYAQAGRMDDALAKATYLIDAFPNSAEVAELNCDVHAAKRDWDGMLLVAKAWKERSKGDSMGADGVIARGYLEQGKAELAAQQLAPYEAVLKKDPDRHAAVVLNYARALLRLNRAAEAAALMKPRLDSPAWRLRWLSLSGSAPTSLQSAAAWIQAVAPSIGADAFDEQVALANAWLEAGKTFNDRGAYKKSLEVVKPVILAKGVKEETLTTGLQIQGWAAERGGDMGLAEESYRQVLSHDGHLPAVQNELAFLLLLKNDAAVLPEALELMHHALAQAPKVATFWDTQAQIELKMGKKDDAVKSWEKARELEPGNVETLIALAGAYVQAGKAAKAGVVVDEIGNLLGASRAPLSGELQKKLDGIRQQLKAANVRVDVTN
ncbi:MAG TPA: tetratricopeptide repeat protein, partial [Tepidisphaeraceae bacterium]